MHACSSSLFTNRIENYLFYIIIEINSFKEKLLLYSIHDIKKK
jgi:hypothetical protein